MFLLQDDFWEIKRTKEKGKGVFAKKEIKKGTVIGDYLGKVTRTRDYDFKSDLGGLYLMYYSDEASIYPNLKKPDVHLLNHACFPNCWLYIYKGHTLFFAMSEIGPGEELTISYLLSPNDGSCNPCTHDCRCENSKCKGTMHLSKDKYTKWQSFQNNQRKETRRAKVVFGENLPKLTSYPTQITVSPIYKEF